MYHVHFLAIFQLSYLNSLVTPELLMSYVNVYCNVVMNRQDFFPQPGIRSRGLVNFYNTTYNLEVDVRIFGEQSEIILKRLTNEDQPDTIINFLNTVAAPQVF